jgi:DNA-binding NarL/FixJ family response regulator
MKKTMVEKMKIRKSLVFSQKEWHWFAKCCGLTRRELEVVRLMCQGWDNRQIAQGLNIKYNTVRAHLSNVYKRMGVKNKVSVMFALLEILRNMPK